ncbi:MAG: helix-turn-helix domain-containing protein [Reichenbachiella sp.]|uniref:helix-turn-helix domain-containing protein n=1 Tax=Reichenbachiella sp. TaxID=2184521 RepID=UPI0032985921
MSLLNDFAYRLRTRREDFGWSQDQLAEKSGVHKSIIGRFECRKVTDPKISMALALAKALEVDHLWLTCRDESENDELKLEKELSQSFKICISEFDLPDKVFLNEILKKLIFNNDMLSRSDRYKKSRVVRYSKSERTYKGSIDNSLHSN